MTSNMHKGSKIIIYDKLLHKLDKFLQIEPVFKKTENSICQTVLLPSKLRNVINVVSFEYFILVDEGKLDKMLVFSWSEMLMSEGKTGAEVVIEPVPKTYSLIIEPWDWN